MSIPEMWVKEACARMWQVFYEKYDNVTEPEDWWGNL